MMGSGKTKVNHTQRGSGKFPLAAAAEEIFVSTKEIYQLLELHDHIWAVGLSKLSVWAQRRPEPNGLFRDGKEEVGDGSALFTPTALFSALFSLWVHRNSELEQKTKQEIVNTWIQDIKFLYLILFPYWDLFISIPPNMDRNLYLI